MIEIYIQFSIDSDECKGVIRIPIAQVLANLRVSSGSIQTLPSAQAFTKPLRDETLQGSNSFSRFWWTLGSREVFIALASLIRAGRHEMG
jgi:hypothetical protein